MSFSLNAIRINGEGNKYWTKGQLRFRLRNCP
jgi:hypothetical protein